MTHFAFQNMTCVNCFSAKFRILPPNPNKDFMEKGEEEPTRALAISVPMLSIGNVKLHDIVMQVSRLKDSTWTLLRKDDFH